MLSRLLSAAAILGLAASVSAQSAPAPLPPLSQAQRAIVEGVPNGRGGEPDRSYVVTNEWGHRVWFPHLEGRGGALVGVGADQTYTLAAAAGSEMIFILDWDAVIPRVHRMYAAIVPECETAEQLLSRFEPEAESATAALIGARLANVPDRDRVVRLYRQYRERLRRYLHNAHQYRHGRTWLNDPSWYTHIRNLHTGHRVVARHGDLTGEITLRAIGDAARALEMPVRVVYFSNAEMFFPNRPSFIRNIENLPTDERSVVLRTVHDPPLEPVPLGRWHYVLQPVSDMRARLATGRYLYRNSLVADLVRAGRRRPRTVTGLSILDDSIPARDDDH